MRGRILAKWCIVGLAAIELQVVASALARGPSATAALMGAALLGFGCYFMYQGANWARWLVIAVIVIRATALAAGTWMALRGDPGFNLARAALWLAAYLVIGILLNSGSVRAYVLHRRQRRSDE